MATWWVAAQDTRTGVKYVVVASGNSQFPSGDLPSISEAAGPYSSQAAAQAVADVLNGAPGGALGVKAPGGSQWWFYNSSTGQVILDTDAITAQGDKLRVAVDPAQWHEYATNADMLAAIAANHWPPPQYQNSVAQNLANAPKQVPGNPLQGLQAIGQFFSDLAATATWLRVAKVVLGGALLLFGLAHMTGASNAAATAVKRLPLPV
jgi:hypothetical protein